MKQQSLIGGCGVNAADLLLDQSEEHKKEGGDLDKVVKSFKSGFGSFMGIFKDEKQGAKTNSKVATTN
jgi:hypothetical protein